MMFTNPFEFNFQIPWGPQQGWQSQPPQSPNVPAFQQALQQMQPQMMLGSQLPMYQPPMMGGLLGKAAGDIPGRYLSPIAGKPLPTNGGTNGPRQGDRFMAVRG